MAHKNDQTQYAWRGLSFQIPSSLDDQTVVTLVEQGARPAYNVTLTAEPLEDRPLEAYVDAQIDELRRSMKKFSVRAKKAQKVAGKSAFIVETEASTSEGAPVLQRQCYLGDDRRVVIVTATSMPDAGDKAGAAFDLLLSTLTIR